MKITVRWFGEKDDQVKLAQIKQIPGVTGVVAALYDIPCGEVWPLDRIIGLKKEIEKYGLILKVVESVNVHEDIKSGSASRDIYIENYKKTLMNLGEAGIEVVCYNFMPVFDWIRTDLNMTLSDGSNTMAYDHELISNLSVEEIIDSMNSGSNGFSLPGWEPDKLAPLNKLIKTYKNINEEKLFENLVYFLERIIPQCEKSGIKMAIHPDDPPWPLFGLPRIINSGENILRVLKAVDSPYNGLTLCSGSLGADKRNDIPKLITQFGKMQRIHFAHVRNIKFTGDKSFYECSHKTEDGSFDMFQIMKAYNEIGFTGYLRPDHGRMVWDEIGRPGYGLYDRAMGIVYINGLWEALLKQREDNF